MVTSFVSAIRINEIESNPSGSDSGNEWVELYSEEEIDLEGYYLQADDKKLNLSGAFSGYLIISFESQFIDNENETVYLKRGEEIIDESSSLDDKKDNEKTWNFCVNGWEFLESSKGEINSCSVNEDGSSEEGTEDSSDDDEVEESSQENEEGNEESDEEEQSKSKTTGKIVLNSPKDNYANKEFMSTEQKIRKGVVYGFLILCVFLIILLALRRL